MVNYNFLTVCLIFIANILLYITYSLFVVRLYTVVCKSAFEDLSSRLHAVSTTESLLNTPYACCLFTPLLFPVMYPCSASRHEASITIRRRAVLYVHTFFAGKAWRKSFERQKRGKMKVGYQNTSIKQLLVTVCVHCALR